MSLRAEIFATLNKRLSKQTKAAVQPYIEELCDSIVEIVQWQRYQQGIEMLERFQGRAARPNETTAQSTAETPADSDFITALKKL